MKTAMIKYPGGNTQSVVYALERLGVVPIVTDSAEEIHSADKVIFPGVGEAWTTMNYLRSRGLDQVLRDLRQPVLGVCLGMQLMCRRSEERNTPGLSIFDVDVIRFSTEFVKVPHMGWNQLHGTKDWLAEGLEGEFTYFVHSYFVPLTAHTVAQATYSQPFSAALRKGNFFAVQFHPEKSGETGARILREFMKQ